jgi:predicted RNase H-like nuclease
MRELIWGIDTTRHGWIMTGIGGNTDVIRFHQNLDALLIESKAESRILTDMPIGLADKSVARYVQRPCDAAARKR